GYKKGDIGKVVNEHGYLIEVFIPHRTSTSGYKPNVTYHACFTTPATKAEYDAQTPFITLDNVEYSEATLRSIIKKVIG
ncbi:unnamed protein product, partial [marine sediment metagenome]